ncbi:aspartyl/asparaginyl beta-hydroxylase domain-containing protein [Sphingomonas sp. NSE70-1]|uniref:Aspartyl/asparaginyl beta-hydroxylase domain-containing protein n=1 Tax=Sphingomonas caseinilyticus TaxID=2908205 RepID=A0ABT0RV24_9SPHN|nr:aspartyl/asparaginyl beta-hydroxylase domain-containing protein [Sphingomonas caseinilyticus]
MNQAGTEAILSQAVEAMGRRDGAAARRLLGSLAPEAINPGNLFLLAQACRMEGDEAAEASAIDRLLRAQPLHLGALLMKGAALARTGDEDGAMAPYQAAVSIAQQVRQRGENLPPMLAAEVDRAAQWVGRHIAERAARIDEALARSGFGPGSRSQRIDEALGILRGDLPIQLQEPTSFYFPGLPQRSFYEREEFEWASALEANTPAIKTELEAMLAAQAEQFEPYVAADADRSSGTAPNAHLAGSTSWSAYHLLKGGEPVEGHAEQFPATLAALQGAPLTRIAGRAPMALFSLLKPGAHIRPHHGLFNFRLICHLPLIVPPGCALRVGNQERQWREGELLIFDDSMEHEARNQSDRQRIILLFEIWRPEISEADREALTVLLEAANITAED